MRIVFVTLGRFKSDACERLFVHYLKLMGRFADASHESLATRGRDAEERDAAVLEWLDRRGARACLTVLDEKGHAMDSRAFASHVEKIRDSSPSEWIVLCGAEHGFGESVKARARQVLSLSAFTFPHELAAVVASEQVFRALSILSRHPYHNG
ncbi:MAG: 23S rRNA (pseudouridine(1915)-N(3))-methyltransferase RlmH [Deltaproteobacteria bacterium]|nr:23S rRNA (pseudouridine(1915)-N(3))-methyltransferase RlmH [Deltaproteobacteria bacterium]